MYRSILASGLALVALAPATLAGQAGGDWRYALDRETVAPISGELTPGAWTYQQMPPGWHLTTTDQGVTLYPNSPMAMQGEWGVEMEFFLFPAPSDDGVGIALMPTAESEHSGELRLLMRRDGQLSATVLTSSDTMLLATWTSDTGVAAHDGEEIKQYVLRVEHRGDVAGRAAAALIADRTQCTAPRRRHSRGTGAQPSRVEIRPDQAAGTGAAARSGLIVSWRVATSPSGPHVPRFGRQSVGEARPSLRRPPARSSSC
jgi:hypothetical protein